MSKQFPLSQHARRLELWLGQPNAALKYAALFVLFVLFSLSALLRQSALVQPPSGDFSAFMGLAHGLKFGDLAGRDIFHAYGIASQFLGAAAVSLHHTGSALDGFPLLIWVWQSYGAALFLLALALLPRINWLASIGVFLGYLCINPLDLVWFRAMLLIVYAILLSRMIALQDARMRRRAAALCGVLLVFIQLHTYDVGVYGFLVTVAVFLFFAVLTAFPSLTRRSDLLNAREHLLLLALTLGTFVLGNLLLSVIFTSTSPNFQSIFEYQLLILERLNGYNNAFGTPWALDRFPTVLLCALIAFTSFYVLASLRRADRRTVFLLVTLCAAALLSLKSAVTRADEGHISLAVTPLFILFLFLGVSWWAGRYERLKIAVWVGLLVCLFFGWPYVKLSYPVSVLSAAANIQNALPAFERLRAASSTVEQVVSTPLFDVVDHDKGLLVFPYDNYYAVALGQRLIVPVLSATDATTTLTQQWYTRVLDRQKDTTDVLYIGERTVDSVQDVSRLPIIFEYLYQNYQAKIILPDNRAYLTARRAPPTDWHVEPLPFRITSNDPADFQLQLAEPARCSLLALTWQASYPVTNILGRTDPFIANIAFGPYPLLSTPIVPFDRDRPITIYLYLGRQNMFLNVFGESPVDVRSWDELQITRLDTGLFGVGARAVQVQNIACITFDRGETARPAPLPATFTDQDLQFDLRDPALWGLNNLTPEGDPGSYRAFGDPGLRYVPALNVCLADYPYLTVDMTIPSGVYALGQVFTLLNNASDYADQPNVLFNVLSDGKPHQYLIELDGFLKTPDTRLTGFRLDPVAEGAQGGSAIELRQVRLLRRPGPSACGNP